MVYFCNLNALPAKLLHHPVRQLQEIIFCTNSSGNPCLVCYYNDQILFILVFFAKIKYAGSELEILTPEYVTFIDVDNSVAVKKERLIYFRFQVQDSRFKVQDSRFKVQNSRFKVSGSTFQVQVTWNFESGIWNLNYRQPGLFSIL